MCGELGEAMREASADRSERRGKGLAGDAGFGKSGFQGGAKGASFEPLAQEAATKDEGPEQKAEDGEDDGIEQGVGDEQQGASQEFEHGDKFSDLDSSPAAGIAEGKQSKDSSEVDEERETVDRSELRERFCRLRDALRAGERLAGDLEAAGCSAGGGFERR